VRRAACLSLLALSAAAAPALGQVGELHLGAIASHTDAYGAGAGIVIGAAPVRLSYAGLRWLRSDGAQLFGADAGLMLPAGPVELMPGLGLGAIRYAGGDTEFFAAPGAAVEVHLGRFAIIPEARWIVSGRPEVAVQRYQGLQLSIRLVATLEFGRIRH